MNADYQIKRAGKQFKVTGPWGEQLVDLFPTKEAAQKDNCGVLGSQRNGCRVENWRV
jgi:hypothetical protein